MQSIHAFLSSLILLTDWQTDKSRQSHLPPPLSEANDQRYSTQYSVLVLVLEYKFRVLVVVHLLVDEFRQPIFYTLNEIRTFVERTNATHWHQQGIYIDIDNQLQVTHHLSLLSQKCLAPTSQQWPSLTLHYRAVSHHRRTHVNWLWVRSIIRLLLILATASATTRQVISSSAPSSQCASVQFTDRTRFQQGRAYYEAVEIEDVRCSCFCTHIP